MVTTQKEERDIVWLPKSLVQKVKEAEDVKAIEAEIVKYVAECKNTMHQEIENMDEDLITYRAAMIKAKDAFSKAKDEQLNAYYALWEKYDAEIATARKKADEMLTVLRPIKQEIEEINKLVTQLERVNLQRTIEQISAIQYASPEVLNMIKFLMENYKPQS